MNFLPRKFLKCAHVDRIYNYIPSGSSLRVKGYVFFNANSQNNARTICVYIRIYIRMYISLPITIVINIALRCESKFFLCSCYLLVCVCARVCERVRVYAHRTCTMEIKSGGKKYEFRDIDDATCNVTLDRVILRVFNNAVYVYVIRAQQTRNSGERRKFVTTTSHAYVAKYRSVFFSP